MPESLKLPEPNVIVVPKLYLGALFEISKTIAAGRAESLQNAIVAMSSYRVFLEQEIAGFPDGKRADILATLDTMIAKLLDEQKNWLAILEQ